MPFFYQHKPAKTLLPVPAYKSARSDRSTISPLPQYQSYAFIPYPDSSSQRSECKPLTLHISSTWTYCGPLLSSSSSLPETYHTWASATVSDINILSSRLTPLLLYLETFLRETGFENYWLTIRATKPTHDYDTPRWHTDAHFFTSKNDNPSSASSSWNTPSDFESEDASDPTTLALGMTSYAPERRDWKLCTTLLGPPTLFQADNAAGLDVLRSAKRREKVRLRMGGHVCNSMRCLGCETYAKELRGVLAEELPGVSVKNTSSAESENLEGAEKQKGEEEGSEKSDEQVVQAPPGHIAFFRTGDEEGAVHSEPKCDVDRIFVNIVPGTKEDLEGLLRKWGMEFPRSWNFGVPMRWGR